MAGRARKNARRRPAARRARVKTGAKGQALKGIKQGVGRTVARPFGSTRAKSHLCCFDAFHHAHLTLPRAIGPYSVVRTTEVISITKKLVILGPFFNPSDDRWAHICGVQVNDVTKPLSDANNIGTFNFGMMNNGSWTAAQITPAAFSVQVMNPGALQTTSGIVYIGRIRTAIKLNRDKGTTGLAIADSLVSYNNPRICAAAKLAMRGVQIDLVPFNMSELANFTEPDYPSFTAYGDNSPIPKGFAPMFIYNPNAIPLQALVCAEWRVRFDPANPAQATHEYHPPASDSAWHRAQMSLEAFGNGVIDIADKVANTGNAVFQAMGAGYRVGRGMRALAGASPLALGM